MKSTIAVPISEKSKQMVYRALGALVTELENLGLEDEASEVYTMRWYLKQLDKDNKLKVTKEIN